MLYLYHHNSSVCAAKVRIALAEKQLAWDGALLDLNAGDQFKPEYLRLNPKAVVPTLVHDSKVITESNVIIEYLDDAFPERPLRPSDPHHRASMRRWLKWLDDGTDGIHWAATVLSYGVSYRHQLIELVGGDSPAHLERALRETMNPHSQGWTREVVMSGMQAPSLRTALMRFDEMLGRIEAAVASHAWLAGPEYSLADVAYAPYVTRLDVMHFSEMWRARPGVRDWYERTRARASFAEVIGRYRTDFLDVLGRHGQRAWPLARQWLEAGRVEKDERIACE